MGELSENAPAGRWPNDVRTLGIDIGGTRLKAAILDPDGKLVEGPVRVDTPHPAPPQAVLAALLPIIEPLGRIDRISIGFPGVVRDGVILTAPNLDTADWKRFPLARAMSDRLGRPTRVLNDATVQGLGVIANCGVECVLTLGTGMGFAVFREGVPGPQMELGQHNARGKRTYDQYVGAAALGEVGRKKWNRRVQRAIRQVETLVTFEVLYIGGGNAKLIDFDLANNIHIVSNQAGITGGVQLWHARLDNAFHTLGPAPG